MSVTEKSLVGPVGPVRPVGSIVISLTTIPARIDKIESVIQGLLNQTYQVDKIILYIPVKLARLDQPYVIPQTLKHLAETSNKFEIRQIDKDYGPATKIIPALKDFTNDNDLIITVDDDILLEKHSIEELIKAYHTCPDYVWGLMGTIEGDFSHTEYLLPNGFTEVNVDTLGGYRGVLYRRQFFQADFFKMVSELEELHRQKLKLPIILCDDTLLNCYIDFKQIRKYITATHYRQKNPKMSPWPHKYHSYEWNFYSLDYGDRQGLNDDLYSIHTQNSSELIKEYFKFLRIDMNMKKINQIKIKI